MKKYIQNDLFTAAKLEDVRVKGKIGNLMDTFFQERVLSDFAQDTIYQEAENAFRTKSDDESLVGLWQGEFWGKWIISAVRVCKYYQDKKLKTFLLQAAHNLIELQREDGYLGTYKESLNVFAPNPADTIPIIGWPCNWNWNIWCRKYTLWGLLEIYLLTEDSDILHGAIRMADHLLKELKENNIDIVNTGTFCGLPSCSIMKPLLILYRLTENNTYLDFCLGIAEHWERDKPGLIVNSLAGKNTKEWYDDIDSWTKVYESLSCFDGLLELYRVTGERKYLKATECFYDILEKCEKNLLFSIGYNDQYRNAADELNAITEPCDVIHYIRVCSELFKLTGKVKYLDSMELCYYNAMLASPCKDGKWGARTVRGACRQEYAHNQANMKHHHCCVNNIPRGLLNAAECAVMTNDNELLINLYHCYEATVTLGKKRVTVRTEGDFVADSRAKIHVNHTVDVTLRIPSWTKQATVIVNGIPNKAKAGLFRIKSADITVNNTDCPLVLEVIFDNSVHIKPFTKPIPQHNTDDWQYQRWAKRNEFERILGRTFQNSPRCVLQKGAILLCRSKLIGNTAEEMFDGDNLIDSGYKCTLEKCKTDADVQAQWIATFSNGEKTFRTKVCDYPFAANIEQNDTEYFSIYF